MKYRGLGNAGIRLSELSLGARVTYGGQVGEEMAAKCMSKAFDLGVNFFDNAEAYAEGKAETVMGGVIKKLGWNRSDIVVSSKVFWGAMVQRHRPLEKAHTRSLQEVSEATSARLPRPLLLPSPGPEYAVRGDSPGHGRTRASGPNPLLGDVRMDRCGHHAGLWYRQRARVTPPQMEQPQYNMLHRDRVEKELPLTL